MPLPHRLEIHEPRLEDRAGDGLQGLIHAAVEVDLVVEGAKHTSYLFLLGKRRNANGKAWKITKRYSIYGTPVNRVLSDDFLKLRAEEVVEQEPWNDLGSIRPHQSHSATQATAKAFRD